MIYTKANALQSLTPNAEWVLRGENLEWFDKTQTQPTDSAIEAEITRLNNAEPLRLLRIERDSKLANTDWVVLDDSPLSASKKTEWKTYRQSLRDLPASASPKLDANGNLDMSSVTFPTEPS
jgi:hypothetical protein